MKLIQLELKLRVKEYSYGENTTTYILCFRPYFSRPFTRKEDINIENYGDESILLILILTH